VARVFKDDKSIIMQENKKIKVAMICHFSNKEVREHLPLDDRKLYSFARKLMRLPAKLSMYADIAIWDTYFIQSVLERDDIELTVISAHSGLKKRLVSFELEGIHYNFVRCDYSTFLMNIVKSDSLWRKINPMTPVIKRLIDNANPDIVVLMGTENAYYSSSVLNIYNYPIYVLCQTVYNNPQFGELSSKRASTELEILKKEKYVGVYSRKHYNLLKGLGYDKFIFDFQFPIPNKEIFQPKPCDKEYDFINFAMQLSEDKGFHDCIKALAIVKKKYPGVRLNLIDGGPSTVRTELYQLISSLNLNENVSFTPFFPEMNDMLQHLQKSRFAVLPCKVDYFSGTQLQSMQYGLPVVCYETEGTPTLNKYGESVLIAEKNNIDDLAEKMLMLMDDDQLANKLIANAHEYIRIRDLESAQNMPRLVDNFKAIISNYKEGTPIPEEQLFHE